MSCGSVKLAGKAFNRILSQKKNVCLQKGMLLFALLS